MEYRIEITPRDTSVALRAMEREAPDLYCLMKSSAKPRARAAAEAFDLWFRRIKDETPGFLPRILTKGSPSERAEWLAVVTVAQAFFDKMNPPPSSQH